VATIRVTCSSCGDGKLDTSEVTVRTGGNNRGGSYSFTCPSCGRLVVKSAEQTMVELLVTSGVRAVTWRAPQLPKEPSADDPPITLGDLSTLRALLQRDDCMDVLRSMTSEA
jgi:uncharacterized Zn finger protein